MTEIHPKHAESLKNREERLALEKEYVARERTLAKQFGLKYVHIRNEDGLNTSKGGATVAYAKTGPSRKLIEVSVALCHANDTYNKTIGRSSAATRFSAGRTVTLRVPSEFSIPEFLQYTFMYTARVL